MKVIGITGGIGSGKSTIAQFLEKLGAVILDSDKLGHEVLRDAEAKQELVAAFGEKVLDPNKEIDRKELSASVFGNAEALSRLNSIVHPRMHRMTLRQIEQYRLKKVEAVVLEVPLLLESNLMHIMDEIWIAVAPEATVLKRISERSGLSEAETLARIHSQMPPDELKKYAHVVIDTDCTLEELEERVMKQWERLLNKKPEMD